MNRSAYIAKAREIDTKIAEAWAAYHTATAPVDALRREIVEIKKTLKRRTQYSANFINSQDGIYYTEKLAKAEAAIPAIYAAAEPLAKIAHEMDRDLYEGWQRFFLVEHIHSSAACSSFRPTTRVGWLPKVSGLTETEAVAEYGAILCTICFPSAPVELTNGSLRDDTTCTEGRDYDAPSREGYFSGNWGTCKCGQRVALTSTGKLRKHKK